MERIQLTNQRSSELGFLRENKVRRGRDRRSLGLMEHQVLFWGGPPSWPDELHLRGRTPLQINTGWS